MNTNSAQHRRRKLHGVPPTARGQFDHELRAPAASLPERVNGSIAIQDGVMTRPGDYAGGYDLVEFDTESKLTRCLLDGAPHRTDGAAVTGYLGDERWRSYWLYGREVSQATVWRKMAYDKNDFDMNFTEGWQGAEVQFRDAMAVSHGDAAEVLERMLEMPPADEDMQQDPESSAFLLGQREAAVRLRRQWVVSLFDNEEIVPMDDVLEEMLDEARQG